MAKLTKAQRNRLAHLIEHIALLEAEYQLAGSQAAKALVQEQKAQADIVLAEEFGVQLPICLSVKRHLR